MRLCFFAILCYVLSIYKCEDVINKCDSPSAKGDYIHVHYNGTLEDGKEFDSSYSRGVPFYFQLGANRVIKGWEIKFLNRCVGDKLKFKLTPDLAYGEQGAPPTIPPNADLYFETEVMKIEKNSNREL